MEMEFTIFPPVTLESEPEIVFDITRQVTTKEYVVVSGRLISIRELSFPSITEEPNDDSDNDTEDNTAENSHIFSVDSPGVTDIPKPGDQFLHWMNFREFVRIRFDGANFENKNELVEGSRCSDVIPWRSVLASSDVARINNPASVSNVVFSGQGVAPMPAPAIVSPT